LERAFALNPLNKDHPANLGRLLSLWGRRANGGEEKLQQAAEWFEVAHRIAPNDATILNELATTMAYLGRPEDAEARFKQSIATDPRFAESYARLGELYRANGRLSEAADQFVAAVERNRSILESDTRQLEPILDSLKNEPQALTTLRDGFERAKQRYDEQRQRAQAEGREPINDVRFLAQLGRVRATAGDVGGMQAAFDEIVQSDPDNVAYRQLYTQTLSNTLQFDAALRQAEEALSLAQQQRLDRQVADIQKLIDVVRAKAGG
jgi:tetratricopeptide (TPR) repeat protein